MTSPVRPIFQEQERLTARRLNAAVEYLRTALRRVLLAPLSPGVAVGLELTQASGATTITVHPGIAIDGRGRLLVLSEPMTFGIVDVQSQITDLGVGEAFSVCLALDDRYASYDPCGPQAPSEVVERVKLMFHKVHPATTARQILPSAGLLGLLESLAPSLAQPWSDLDPAGRSSNDFFVRLGQVTWDEVNLGGLGAISMASRAGVVPRFAGLRNSFGQMSLVLGRDAGGKATIGIAVPTIFGVGAAVTFQAPVDFQTDLLVKGAATFQQKVSFQKAAGGPLAQAAMIATDVGAPPAGRVNPDDARVFEAAGGVAGAPGAGGVLAVSMEYVGVGTFPTVEHAGFPLVLAANGSAPILAPFDGSTFPVGLSAGKSSIQGGVAFVPIAAAGLLNGRVRHTGANVLPVGTELTPVSLANAAPPTEYPLKPALHGDIVVARAAVPLSTSASTQDLLIWVMPPYSKP